jgi:L-amino acid N-acyltransferase YncA
MATMKKLREKPEIHTSEPDAPEIRDPRATQVEILDRFLGSDLADLCQATVDAVIDGQGFGWVKPPATSTLEAYWRGVLLMPDRTLLVARFDGAIVGTLQLVRPPKNNEAGAFAAEVMTFFIASWARGHGLGRGLLAQAEALARREGFKTLDTSIRGNRVAAIALAEGSGFKRWGTKERYARVDNHYLPGYFYSKNIDVPDIKKSDI